MAGYNKFNIFVLDLGLAVHNLDAAQHVIKVYASDATPDAENDAVKADLAEISAANGYPSGGSDITNTWTRSTGTATCGSADTVVWTASGGSFGPLRYIPTYNATTAAKTNPLICWWDYTSEVTVLNGETFTVDFGASVFTLA